ncbi:MAG: HEAT repeat domain-containing protein [Myxococcota bacterium]
MSAFSPLRIRLRTALLIAWVLPACSPAAPVERTSDKTSTVAGASPMSQSPQALLEAHLKAQGRDISTLKAQPSLDVGPFRAFQLPGAGFYFVSERGVLTPDGQGDWTGFLQVAEPMAVAQRLERFYASDMAQLQLPDQTPPSQVSMQAWKLVQLPTRRVVEQEPGLEPGTVVFQLWLGRPPAFGPMRYTITAPPQGPARIEQVGVEALMPATDQADALLKSLESGSKLAQVSAAETLGKRGETRAIPGLQKLLKSTYAPARAAAANALGQLNATASVSALGEALLAERDQTVLNPLVQALKRIGGAEAKAALSTAAQQHPQVDLRPWLTSHLQAMP